MADSDEHELQPHDQEPLVPERDVSALTGGTNGNLGGPAAPDGATNRADEASFCDWPLRTHSVVAPKGTGEPRQAFEPDVTRRSKDLEAASRPITGRNGVEGGLNQYGPTIVRDLRSRGEPQERSRAGPVTGPPKLQQVRPSKGTTEPRSPRDRKSVV